MEEFKPRDYIEMETEANMDRADGLADELENSLYVFKAKIDSEKGRIKYGAGE